MMPTLEDYLKDYADWHLRRPAWFFHSAHVLHLGWDTLYVRAGKKYITLLGESKGTWHDACFTLANIRAENPGTGTFRQLIAWFQERYGWPILVECVQSARFMGYLLRNGFVETSVPQNVVLLGKP